MNSCQYNLLISIICQCPYFIRYIFHGTAADSSTCIWNNTICAKLVASILNFNISSCMISRSGQVEGFILFCMPDIFQFYIRQYFLSCLFIFCTSALVFFLYSSSILIRFFLLLLPSTISIQESTFPSCACT